MVITTEEKVLENRANRIVKQNNKRELNNHNCNVEGKTPPQSYSHNSLSQSQRPIVSILQSQFKDYADPEVV